MSANSYITRIPSPSPLVKEDRPFSSAFRGKAPPLLPSKREKKRHEKSPPSGREDEPFRYLLMLQPLRWSAAMIGAMMTPETIASGSPFAMVMPMKMFATPWREMPCISA